MTHWLTRVAMCQLYPSVEGLVGIEEARLVAYLREYRREAPLLFRVGLSVSVWLYTLSPVLTVFLPLPSFLLPRRLADRHANRAATHPLYLLRQSTLLIKMMAGLCWGRGDAVRVRLGLAPIPPDPGTWRTGP